MYITEMNTPTHTIWTHIVCPWKKPGKYRTYRHLDFTADKGKWAIKIAFKVISSGRWKQGCVFPLRTLSSFCPVHEPSTQNAASCMQSAFHSQQNRSKNTLIDTLRGKFLDDLNPIKSTSKINGHSCRLCEKRWSISEHPITVTVSPTPEVWMTCWGCFP